MLRQYIFYNPLYQNTPKHLSTDVMFLLPLFYCQSCMSEKDVKPVPPINQPLLQYWVLLCNLFLLTYCFFHCISYTVTGYFILTDLLKTVYTCTMFCISQFYYDEAILYFIWHGFYNLPYLQKFVLIVVTCLLCEPVVLCFTS